MRNLNNNSVTASIFPGIISARTPWATAYIDHSQPKQEKRCSMTREIVPRRTTLVYHLRTSRL